MDDILNAGRIAIQQGATDQFADAVSALMPVAQTDVGRYLVRNGRINVGSGDDLDRPIEHLASALDSLATTTWTRNNRGPNPRAWFEVSQSLAESLVMWMNENKIRNMDAETLLVNVLKAVEQLGMTMARDGRGDEATWALDAVFAVARASNQVHFSELPRDCADFLAFIGLIAEEHGLAWSDGLVSVEAARMVNASVPTEVRRLKREVRIAGQFAQSPEAARNAFIARL